MSIVANICWSFVPGSTGTLVEYKVAGDPTWIRPLAPDNPTTNNCYSITVDPETLYDIRLTTYGIKCGPKSTTFQIVSGACCPPTYILSDDGTYCYKTGTTTAIPPSSSENTVAKTNTDYSVCGSYIFDPGFNTNGTGTASQITLSNSWWRNGPGLCVVPQATNQGPMNRCALWATTEAPSQQVGFSVCITVTETKTYYMGVGADNFMIIRVDGNTILSQDASAMDAQFGTPSQTAPLRVWCIYPIILTAGTHVVELIGQNFPDPIPNPAAMGAEIYDNTPAEIAAATSYAGLNLVFSTKDYVGQPVQIGSGGIGYTCPPGYSLILCDGPAYCTQTVTTSVVPCNVSTTTTTTTSTTSTTTTTTTT